MNDIIITNGRQIQEAFAKTIADFCAYVGVDQKNLHNGSTHVIYRPDTTRLSEALANVREQGARVAQRVVTTGDNSVRTYLNHAIEKVWREGQFSASHEALGIDPHTLDINPMHPGIFSGARGVDIVRAARHSFYWGAQTELAHQKLTDLARYEEGTMPPL